MPNFNYLAFVHGGIPIPGNSAITDGIEMAEQCLTELRKLDNPEQFPPRLLILLVSAGYLEGSETSQEARTSQLIQGIHQTFEEDPNIHGHDGAPLIGSSVAAVFFKHPSLDHRVHERGVLLVCLASRLIEAKVAVGMDARKDPEGATTTLLREFELDPEGKVDPNPLSDRVLFTFYPGFGSPGLAPGYPAPELQRMLRQGSRTRIRVAGGVSSAGDPNRKTPGLQFADKDVFRDAVVAARIITGIPIGISLAHGLTQTGQVLRVKTLSQDKKIIEEFEEGIAAEVIRQAGEHILLGRMSTDCEPMIAVPRVSEGGRVVQLLREIKEQDYFELLKPEPEKILEAAIRCVAQSRDRILIQNPVANLMLICNSWRLQYQKAGLNVECSLEEIEKQVPDAPCVGGFVDGETGEDETGRSLFNNGSVMAMVFGDEMRERTPLHRGFAALVKHGPKMTGAAKPDPNMTATEFIDEAIDEALRIVVETGFPGAMFSLILRNGAEKFIVARNALGSHFKKIVDDTRRPFLGNDILAAVARERKSRFVRDSRQDPSCDKLAVEKSGIISQYVIPLMRLDGKVPAILQVDLGEVHSLKQAEKEVLESLGTIIAASLNRLFNYLEAKIGRELDPALNISLSAATVEDGLQYLIERAAEAFGVNMGQVRLANHETGRLILVAGVGDCYENAKDIRREVNFEEITPICQAFRQARKDREATIVNSSQNDFAYQEMCKSNASNTQLLAALRKIRSYASVAFMNEDGVKLGAMSLTSSREWFFTRSHMIALKALGKRLSFLVEHFNSKESEKAGWKRVEFILKGSPRLAEIENLDDLSGELAKATERFCKEVKAQWGSLYLWDEDRKYYILRAQHGWQKPEWVNAARYSKDDLWTGASAAEGKPVYIPNLFQHYRERRYQERYTLEAFGFRLSEKNAVEAIGLPLKVGEKRLGILTLYRPKEGITSGFAILDQLQQSRSWEEVLLESASDIAGLASVLSARQIELWAKEEQNQRQGLYPKLNQEEDRRAFATRVCQEVLNSFHAVRADFYKVEETETEKKLLWLDGYSRDLNTKRITEEEHLPSDSLGLVKETFDSEQIRVQRHVLTDEEREHPGLAKTEGLVERACVPLVGVGKLVGILDLQCLIQPDYASSLIFSHSEKLLRFLGTMIGSIYLRHQVKIDAERSQRAAEAAGAYSFQQAHRRGNALQRIYRLSQSIKENKDERRREEEINELLKTTEIAMRTTKSIMELGESVLNQDRHGYSLSKLAELSLEEIDSDKLGCIQDRKIEVENNTPKDIIVYADLTLAKEAFVNLLNNAIQAILDKNSQSLNILSESKVMISASVTEDRRNVIVVFEDTGIGMNDGQINTALHGFFNTKESRGVGVLISRLLLAAQGGLLTYESKVGSGTKAIVTLPLAYWGEKPKVVAELPKPKEGEKQQWISKH